MKKKNYLVAGVDEAGRGPLAGPVFAAAVILDFKKPIAGLKDSKLLSEKSREYLFNIINEKCLAVAVGSADVLEIDKLNILHASMLAMQRALLALTINPEKVLVDGNRCPDVPFPSEAIVKGDQKIAAISAASIIAKVTRDRLMRELHQHYPNYGFVHNKGYPTEFHLRCLQKFGPCEIHRSTFEPVRMAASIHHTLLSGQER